MVYTVRKLAQLSGVSVRTLHFYDAIGLLKPARVGENQYRYYEEEQHELRVEEGIRGARPEASEARPFIGRCDAGVRGAGTRVICFRQSPCNSDP
jgi:hypothetical protein